jgi:hypothetical protein
LSAERAANKLRRNIKIAAGERSEPAASDARAVSFIRPLAGTVEERTQLIHLEPRAPAVKHAMAIRANEGYVFEPGWRAGG